MKLTVEKRTLGIITLFSLISVVIIVAVIIPTIRHIKEIDAETFELRQYLERKHQKTMNLRSSLKKIDTVREEIKNYPEYLFRAGSELQLVTTLEDIAAKSGVTQKINTSNLTNITNNTVTLNVTATGEYDNVLGYIVAIEQMKYFMHIYKLDLAPAPVPNKRATTTAVSATLDMSLYVAN